MTARKDKRKGWIVDFVFTFPDGNQKRVRKRSQVQTRQGAEGYERQLRKELLNPVYEKPKKEVPRFGEFADSFNSTYVKNNNKPSTQCSTEANIENHLKPNLGEIRLDKIAALIEPLKANLRNLELSPKTINNILGILSRILSYAVEIGVIESKPKIKMLKLPPVKIDFLDFEEYERLVAVLHTEPLWGSAIFAAGEGGFRAGEILGMYQEDIDHVAGVITVRRALWRGHLGSPKGGRDRKVPMTKRLVNMLRKERHLKGNFVWCDSAGEYLTHAMAEKAIQRVARRAGLRKIGWHTLRHTFCSHLAMKGAPPKAIQELAGHKDISTTMKYMHLAPATLVEAVSLLDERATERQQTENHGTILAPQESRNANYLKF